MRWMQRISKPHVLVGLLVLSVVSSLARPRGFDWPREMLAPLLTPMSHAGTYLALGIRRNVRDWVGGGMDEDTARRLLAENDALRRRVVELIDDDLRRRLLSNDLRMVDLQRQVAQMRQWRDQQLHEFPCMIVPAEIVGADPTSFRNARLLRPEAKATPGQLVTTRELMTHRPTAIPAERAVLSAVSLVGEIESSGAWTAHLRLVTDPDFHIQALVKRIPVPGKPRLIWVDQPLSPGGKDITMQRPLQPNDPPVEAYLAGRGTDLLIAGPLPARYGVAPGDRVVTKGYEGRLPAGVHIGTVEAVHEVPNKPNHVQLEVRPGTDLPLLSEVYIIMPRFGEGP